MAQHLKPALSVYENVLLSLSVVTPASSVFIIVPVAFANYGAATFWGFIIAAIVGLLMSLCWAELGATYRTSGGDYALISRAINGSFGFANLGLQLVLGLFIPAVLALGMATYLGVLFPFDAKLTAAMTIVVSAIISMLHVRLGATVNGLFVYIQMAALAAIAILGFTHIQRPFADLLFPAVTAADGTTSPATFALVMAGVATAIFAYNGYNNPVYYGEETVGSAKGVATAVIWSLVIVVLVELIPVTAVLLGASSIADLGKSPDLTAFVAERGGTLVNTVVSLAVAGSIFSAVTACIMQIARALFNAGREQLFPLPISQFFASLHPQTNSPLGATIFAALFGVIVVLSLNVVALVTFTGAFLTIAYMMIALAAICSRMKHPNRTRDYQMPGYPLPPIVALLGLLYVFTQQTPRDILITLSVLVAFLVYYFVYIRPSEHRRRALESDLEPAEALVPVTSDEAN
jgi:amino acid transporter